MMGFLLLFVGVGLGGLLEAPEVQDSLVKIFYAIASRIKNGPLPLARRQAFELARSDPALLKELDLQRSAHAEVENALGYPVDSVGEKLMNADFE